MLRSVGNVSFSVQQLPVLYRVCVGLYCVAIEGIIRSPIPPPHPCRVCPVQPVWRTSATVWRSTPRWTCSIRTCWPRPSLGDSGTAAATSASNRWGAAADRCFRYVGQSWCQRSNLTGLWNGGGDLIVRKVEQCWKPSFGSVRWMSESVSVQ